MVCGPASVAVPPMTSTPSAATRAVTSDDCARASALIRRCSRVASTGRAPSPPPSPPPGLMRIPRSAALFSTVTVLDVSIRVLEGTQSVSTQAPPSPSRSASVTSAPSCAATSAAS